MGCLWSYSQSPTQEVTGDMKFRHTRISKWDGVELLIEYGLIYMNSPKDYKTALVDHTMLR